MSVSKLEPSLVTILIPNLNGEKFLERAVLSALQQTYSCKVLVVDNGSTDGSLIILKRLKKIHKKLDYFVEEKPGISAALNAGIHKINTKYIARLDSDDLMQESRIEKQIIEFVKNPNLVLVGSNMNVIDANDKFGSQIFCPEDNLSIVKSMRYRNPIAHPSVLLLRDAVVRSGMYRSKFDGAEDLDLWLRLQECGQFHNIQEPLTLYRAHDHQATKIRNLYRVELKVRIQFLFKHPNRMSLLALFRIIDLIFMSLKIGWHRRFFSIFRKFKSN